MRQVFLYSLALLLIPFFIADSSASNTGIVNEVVSNDHMQLYVVSVKYEDRGGQNKLANVEVILKNTESETRIFNPFFAKAVLSSGYEEKANPLYGTIQPIRIAPNDTLRGILAFPIPKDETVTMLIWEESAEKLTVDITKSKNPADTALKSEWVLSSNKGMVLSDSMTQLTIHDDVLDKTAEPAFYLVDISIKNLGSEIKTYSSTFAFVKDQEGYLYPSDIQNLNLLNNPLGKGQLIQGGEVRGQILFLLPTNVRNVMFIYDENLGTGSYFMPEFPYHMLILITSVGTGVFLARLGCRT
jgi:hypothetical protein